MSLPREERQCLSLEMQGKVQAAAVTLSPFCPKYTTDHAAVVVIGKKEAIQKNLNNIHLPSNFQDPDTCLHEGIFENIYEAISQKSAVIKCQCSPSQC